MNLADVRGRIAAACAAAGRDPSEVTLVAVTKTWPESDVRLLADLGVTDVGENRVQEAAPKARACAGLDVVWHFVGRLQTNKCRSVAGFADVVHSVDRDRLVSALGSEARAAERVVRCLVQIDLTGVSGGADRPSGGGVAPAGADRLADMIANTDGLTLAGVMAMAPREGVAERAFARLAEVAERLRGSHRDAEVISAGMSGDLEAAIAHGATHVRIGTALLGTRSVAVG